MADRCYIIGEIGINHNGDLATALQLIDVAKAAGCNAVKFQKRSPRDCVPKAEWGKPRETPWGTMKYIDYRDRMEFGVDEFNEIDNHCRLNSINWFSSVFDTQSVDFFRDNHFSLPYLKIPSAKATDIPFLKYCQKSGMPRILSTGACDRAMIKEAVAYSVPKVVMHCTSTYPCPVDELNLNAIKTLCNEFPGMSIGYSGHEVGIPTSLAAVAMGATMIERHITLDRTSWGSDHAASLEPHGLTQLVNGIRAIERAMGVGALKIFESEKLAMQRLRVVT